MTEFRTQQNGNQWSGMDWTVSYVCDSCGKLVKNAQVQWEDHKVHDKIKYCPYCGAKAPDEFPIYTDRRGWIYKGEKFK